MRLKDKLISCIRKIPKGSKIIFIFNYFMLI